MECSLSLSLSLQKFTLTPEARSHPLGEPCLQERFWVIQSCLADFSKEDRTFPSVAPVCSCGAEPFKALGIQALLTDLCPRSLERWEKCSAEWRAAPVGLAASIWNMPSFWNRSISQTDPPCVLEACGLVGLTADGKVCLSMKQSYFESELSDSYRKLEG